MNDSTRQPRARQAESQEARTSATNPNGLVQLPDARKVEILRDALTRLLARHSDKANDVAFIDAQQALNVVTHGVKPEAL